MSSQSWFVDELAHAGAEHLDPGYVAGYERKAGLDVDAEVAALRELGLGPTSTLVELGTGTGSVALAAAAVGARVIAVDVSSAMLAAVRAKLDQAPLANVEIVQAGLLSYVHSGPPADIVYARHCLHQLPDFWKAIALRRIARVLRPDGVLRVRDLLLSCEIDDVPDVVEAWLSAAGDDPSRGWTRPELETHLQQEHSTFTWLFEPMLRRAGFEIVSSDYSQSRVYAGYTCVREQR